jgi:xanthine/uracil/vitamin C permease (AzgA family)
LEQLQQLLTTKAGVVTALVTTAINGLKNNANRKQQPVTILANIVGSIFGTTTTTSYIESTSGVAVGARTGFASIVTGC